MDYPDIVRGQMNLKRLQLTDLKIDIPRVPKKKTLAAALEEAGRSHCFQKLECVGGGSPSFDSSIPRR